MDPSIVNYLNSIGQKSDYASRAQLAASKGITGYVGSAQQNTQLLNLLRGGAAPAQKILPQSQALAPKPTSTAQPVSQPTQQVASVQQQPQQSGVPPIDYSKYVGWNDQAAITADWNATWQQKTGGGATSGVSGVPGFNQARPTAPNFQNIYDTALTTATTGIQPQIDAINSQIATKTDAYNAQVSKIKDNPYLSEATMTGRISKLSERFNADMQLETKKQAIVEGKMATARADAQVKLNIAAQQYNVESQEYQQNLTMFSNLLSSGALENASGADIAQITSSTGLSSSMVQSIIDFQKKKNAPKLDLKTVDDGTNQYVVAVDSSGNVISKQIIAASKPKAATKPTADETKQSRLSEIQNNLANAAGSDGYVSPDDYAAAIRDAIRAGYAEDQANALLSGFKNPSNPNYYLPSTK